ncbi:undecaprenyl-phosphate glucose phosphotransferase [Pontibacter harenae]|uniref:undecaprenyl-phosphate glucose phosphotransferase n=1 Tax=Pontibacter harenae TaxID=2894083 RepID=UPI001E50EF67|nr:undecaprenyl-phosphate glucose phosphotransferase [Pontibacter harenae]MCC9166597.1 undecaprenyl-phosphate glucose phosphotransferase [Pontibacter harenae]
MPRFYPKYISLIHSTGDLAVIAISTATAFYFTKGEQESFLNSPHFRVLPYCMLAWLACVRLLNSYKSTHVNRRRYIVLEVLKPLSLYIVLIEALQNIFDLTFITREFLIINYISLFFIIVSWRLLVTSGLRYYRLKGFNLKRFIIVGYGQTGRDLKKYLVQHPEFGYRFYGFFDNAPEGKEDVVGKIEDLERFVLDNHIDEIYCCPFEVNKQQITRLIDFVDNNLIRLKFLPESNTTFNQSLKIDLDSIFPILITRSIPLDDVVNKSIKRIFDIFFSLFVIVFLLSWLLPILAIIIKLNSKGPVFFQQERSGIKNKTFKCWKLRSMYVNTEANSQLARRGDSRITPVGAFLRKTSMDELPQFFNVLMGQMSIVGPRPHMLKANSEYALVAEKYMVRHFVKPGITGLSQVRGYRGETTTIYQIRGRAKLDIFYLENWSFLLDLKIIFVTVYNVFKGDNDVF